MPLSPFVAKNLNTLGNRNLVINLTSTKSEFNDPENGCGDIFKD